MKYLEFNKAEIDPIKNDTTQNQLDRFVLTDLEGSVSGGAI